MSEKFKTLLLTPVFEGGGTEVYILNLINYLRTQNISPDVLSGGGIRQTELNNMGVNHFIDISLRKKNIIYLFRSISNCLKILKLNKYNLIHTSSIYTTIIAKIASKINEFFTRKHIPVVITLHGGPNRDIERNSARILNFFADGVISLSNNSKEILVNNGLSNEKVTVIYNGIFVEDIHNLLSNNFDQKCINIITCGRLTQQKGQVYLIRALKQILLKKPNSQLYILGEGELEQNLKEEVINLGLSKNVTFLGFQEDALSIVNNADVFVLPSLWEQFPISILEAMALKKPIIASSVNGIPEQLGDTGILVEPGNVKGIIDALNKLLDSPGLKVELGEKAFQRYQENFTLNCMGKKTLIFYENTINKKQ
ncbi:glycosyltransferase family 4 protein [Priestia aryabhattai]|uniref:glycosyltransferase family 4 protein n=1 Tax=Priestia aryabhattai TaxID=412384 RepID=UPI003D2E52E8